MQIAKKEELEPVQIKLTILETTNHITEPFIREGVMIQEPKVGQPFRIMNFAKNQFVHSTTKVTTILDKHTFNTENSKYKIEFLT